MSETDVGRAPVLAWRRNDGEPQGLWEQAGELGWLPESPRFVLQIGQRGRSQLVVDSARSLARFLLAHHPNTRIEVLDPEGSHAEWSGLAVTRIGDGAPISVSGIAAPEIAVPRLWFEAYTLVTMATPVPCQRTRLAGVLDAQAEPLRRLGNRHDSTVLAYEAHRLAASDLVVACGTVRRGDRSGGCWWAVGPTDVAVESAVGAAAGVSGQGLPLVRALARHERVREVQMRGESLPAIDGYLAPAWVVHANGLGAGFARTARGAIRDALMIRRNLGKVPGFVRRKLASRARGAA